MDLINVIFGGGITGLFGTIVSQLFSIWKSAEDRKTHALDLAHEITLQQMQLESLKQETEREVYITGNQALTQAYEHDASYGTPSEKVVNVLRLFRPCITVLLILLTASIYFTTTSGAIQLTVVDAIIYSTISAITFWFADRSISKSVQSSKSLPWR